MRIQRSPVPGHAPRVPGTQQMLTKGVQIQGNEKAQTLSMPKLVYNP